ncbi:unnamed protein product [Kuraishia capsulata CBS 1993]|uniref:Peptidase M24 domain-containing protein n=1 Tax=Kuraishia capsulata CBS 1993 TaxID=1382522 RepID=W6MQA3_9ASCO|nr:uncharacterized protein KUCA_T00004909001 [Kuraishia capsulata CBS 1993]CDK28924.1 unnamed protein product [Kuraishia capsulata CBS 1993]
MSEKIDNSINNSDVVQKYKTAGEISGKVLAHVKTLCVAGAKVYDICVAGDELLDSKLGEIYNNKKTSKIPKGIAFPTTVSPNEVTAHLSPINADEPSNIELKAGDVVKIELGAHVDGFASIVADTIVVDAAGPITGRVADVLAAAHYASEAAIRTMEPGKKNWDVTRVVDQVAKAYGCVALEGMLSHNQERNKLNGPKEIIINPSEQQKASVAAMKFEDAEVYGLDILISTGDGKVKQGETRTTIYKLTGNTYQLKLKASRAVLNEIKEKASDFPFSTRNLNDPTKGRMGLQECVNHNVMNAYDVMYEKEGAIIAQFYTTVAVTKNGNVKLSSPDFDISSVQSDKKIEDQDILDVLEKSLKVNKKKAKKAAAAASA